MVHYFIRASLAKIRVDLQFLNAYKRYFPNHPVLIVLVKVKPIQSAHLNIAKPFLFYSIK